MFFDPYMLFSRFFDFGKLITLCWSAKPEESYLGASPASRRTAQFSGETKIAVDFFQNKPVLKHGSSFVKAEKPTECRCCLVRRLLQHSELHELNKWLV